MTVRHNDMSIISFNLPRRSVDKLELSSFERVEHTISKVSQSVPVPLRNTSSGLKGMMLHSEKMKG